MLRHPLRRRPRAPNVASAVKPVANTILLVDCSLSMSGPILAPNGQSVPKRDAAIEATIILARHKATHCPKDLLGCVGFGSQAFVVFRLTRSDDLGIVSKIRGLRLNGTTNMQAGLSISISLLEQRPRSFLRNIVLLSDGLPDSRDGLDDLAQRARTARINLHTVGVGEARNFDEALLRRLSSTTHRGRYQHVLSLQDLARALKVVA